LELSSLSADKIVHFKSLDDTEFLYVDSVENLKILTDHLKEKEVKEIAIDLEAHSMRSYQGILCLMQVSTRVKDFIVDLISLREHIGDAFRSIMDDPSKIKILHGADSDI